MLMLMLMLMLGEKTLVVVVSGPVVARLNHPPELELQTRDQLNCDNKIVT